MDFKVSMNIENKYGNGANDDNDSFSLFLLLFALALPSPCRDFYFETR